MKKIVLSIILLAHITLPIFGQVLLEQEKPPAGSIPGKLVINGTAKELQTRLRNVVVILYQDIEKTGNWVEIEKQLTRSNGEFSFKLDLEGKYMIEVARGGYTTKKVTFDTEVYELTNQPAPFDFEVDMVPDRDGLGYLKPVAEVFYYAKRKEFDYRLDYSKEEMEEEARLERERLEKLEFQRKAAEEKALRELQAEKLIKDEKALGEESIEAAIKIGKGNKEATIQAIKKTFLETDTLAEKKAEAIYVEYEKQKLSSANAVINYGSLFEAGKKFEEKIIKEKQEEIKKVQEQIQQAKAEIAKKEKEALDKQKEIAAIELQSKLAEATKIEAERKRKEEEEQKQKIQQAIAAGSGNKEATIKQLENVFSKTDPYKAEKATALYEAYEKQKLSGTTTSNINYSSLFAAADLAEIKAKEAAEEQQRESQKQRVDEYVKKVNEKNAKEEAASIAKIEEAIKSAAGDKDKLIEAFKQTFDKDDPFAEHKAKAMYDQYESDRKMRQIEGKNYAAVDFKSIFNAGKQAELTAVDAERKKKEEALAQSEIALYMAMEEKRKERQKESQVAEVGVKKVRDEKLQQAKSAEEKKIQNAIEAGNGNREATINALKNALPANAQYREEKAKAMYEQYEKDKKQAELSGQTNISIDFKSLFAAADLAEVQQLQKSFEEKKKAEFEVQEKRRIENEVKAKEILASKSEEAEKIFASADKKKEEAEAKAEEEKRVREELAKAAEEKRLKEEADAKRKAEEIRLAEEKKLADEAVAKEKAAAEKKAAEEAAARLAEEKRLKEEAEALAKAESERKKKEAAEARIAEEKRLAEEAVAKAKAEAERKAAEEAARLAEEKRLKEEAAAIAKAEAEKKVAEETARLAEEKRQKEEAEAKARAEAEKKAAEEAARLAEEKRQKEEAEAKARAEALKKAEEEAARLAEEKRLKEEAEAKARVEAEKKAAEEAARLAEEKRLKEEAEKKAREEAARLAEEKRLKEEAEAKAKAEAEKKAREEAARLAEEKRLREEAEAKAREVAEAKRLEEEKKKQEEYKKAQEEAKRLSEEERKKRFEEAQARAASMQANEKERRAQFLSDIALIYPEGLTEENIDGKDFKLKRFIINEGGAVTVYDKKTWNWGGIFCFKNTDIAITEALFNLEVNKYKSQ